MTVLLLGGSPSFPSTTWRLQQLVGERLAALGHRTGALQVRELPALALLRADVKDPAIADAVARVRDADAIVIGTPVYKASFSGVLKAFLDLLPQDGLRDKTVWSLATGGSLAHLLALDYALLPVLSSLGARSQIDPLFATDSQLQFGTDGECRIGEDVARRLGVGARKVFELLPHKVPVLERC